MAAGILMLTAGVFNIVWLIVVLARIIDAKAVFRFIWVVSPLPYFGVATGYGGNIGLSNVLAFVFLMAIFVSIFGGVLSLGRKPWGLVLTGAIGTLLCFPILGLVAIILTIMSRRRFKRPLWYLD